MQLKAFEWEQFNAMDGTLLHCIVQSKHCWSLDPLTWSVADSAMLQFSALQCITLQCVLGLTSRFGGPVHYKACLSSSYQTPSIPPFATQIIILTFKFFATHFYGFCFLLCKIIKFWTSELCNFNQCTVRHSCLINGIRDWTFKENREQFGVRWDPDLHLIQSKSGTLFTPYFIMVKPHWQFFLILNKSEASKRH